MNRIRHHQSGHVFLKGSNWYLRYREDVTREDGSIERIQKCRRLAKAGGKYRSKRSVEQLAEDILRPLNDGTSTAESTMSLNQFIEDLYLPYAEEQKRRSTYCGYKNLWLRYVKPDGGLALRDFRTLDGQRVLRSIADREDLSRPTLGHIKHFLSGVFRYARRQGVLNSPNPMHDVEIPKGRPAGETYAYSHEEEALMLTALPEPAATVVATAAFTGARKGEIRGLLWENYDGCEIGIMTSVWRSHVEEPKRPRSKGSIPVVAQLKTMLERHRAACGNPSSGFVFADASGKPMNLEALARDVIRPALDKSGVEWHGWHAFRRGLATNLHRLGVSDKVIQQILRHANVTTTMNIYVKTASSDAAAAMRTLEKMCATTVQPMPLASTRVM
jgi:integrase